VNEPGAFAQYLRLPAFNVVPLPDAIDDEIGAILDPSAMPSTPRCPSIWWARMC
jgi:threonine dehydrogenase-like Zn-dependent dehydrogenase